MTPPWPDRVAAARAALAVLGAALLAAAVVFLMRQSGTAMPYPLALAVVLTALALRGLAQRAATPRAGPPAAPPVPRRAPGRSGDGYDWSDVELIGSPTTRWESRLDWAGDAPERFVAVRAELAALADERLRLRHGCTRASDPERARALLGEPLWHLLAEAEPPSRAPAPEELAALVARLEAV